MSAVARRAAGVGIALVILAVVALAADGAWLNKVPATSHVRVNPLAGRPDSAAAGRLLYAENCASCHGSDAKGMGRRPGLVSRRIQQATDGDLAWLLENGNLRKGMPSWSKLPDERRWQIITYIRELNTPMGVWGAMEPFVVKPVEPGKKQNYSSRMGEGS